MIVVMQHGRVVEMGQHDMLLAAAGVYANLYQTSQADGVIPNGVALSTH